MTSQPPFVIVGVLTLVAIAAPASAQGLDEAATHAPAQHYMITLPPTPVAEVAEVVLGQSLGLPFKVDGDVEAEMTFRVDGAYSPRDLAREFGYRLWNVDVALIERPSDGLWLIPEAELPAALAAGAVVVSPLASTPARPPRPAAKNAPMSETGKKSAPGWAWLAWLVGGWAAGIGSALGWLRLRSRSERAATPLLTAPQPIDRVEPEIAPELDDGLVIPTFGKIDPSLAATLDRSGT